MDKAFGFMCFGRNSFLQNRRGLETWCRLSDLDGTMKRCESSCTQAGPWVQEWAVTGVSSRQSVPAVCPWFWTGVCCWSMLDLRLLELLFVWVRPVRVNTWRGEILRPRNFLHVLGPTGRHFFEPILEISLLGTCFPSFHSTIWNIFLLWCHFHKILNIKNNLVVKGI